MRRCREDIFVVVPDCERTENPDEVEPPHQGVGPRMGGALDCPRGEAQEDQPHEQVSVPLLKMSYCHRIILTAYIILCILRERTNHTRRKKKPETIRTTGTEAITSDGEDEKLEFVASEPKRITATTPSNQRCMTTDQTM
jgi:hypothetical protein